MVIKKLALTLTSIALTLLISTANATKEVEMKESPNIIVYYGEKDPLRKSKRRTMIAFTFNSLSKEGYQI